MKELTYKSLSDIYPVIAGQNPTVIKARLNQLLPAEMRDVFAPVKIAGVNALWFGDDDKEYQPYAAAGAAERNAVAMTLNEVRDYFQTNLRDEFPYMESLFIIPADDAIFWYKDPAGKVHPVLTQWAFRKRDQMNPVDIIDILIRNIQPVASDTVTLFATRSDGKPAANFPFRLLIFNNVKEEETDESGAYPIGKMMPGTTFAVEDMGGNQHQEFTVAPGAAYNAVFELTTSWTVTVKNQTGETKKNFKLLIDGKEYATDSEGVIRFENVLMKPEPVKVSLITGNGEVAYTLSRTPEANNFIYQFDEDLPEPPFIITVRDYDGTPLKNMPIKIIPEGMAPIEAITDDSGVATVAPEKLKPGKYKVEVFISKEKRAQLKMEKKQRKELEKQKKKERKQKQQEKQQIKQP